MTNPNPRSTVELVSSETISLGEVAQVEVIQDPVPVPTEQELWVGDAFRAVERLVPLLTVVQLRQLAKDVDTALNPRPPLPVVQPVRVVPDEPEGGRKRKRL